MNALTSKIFGCLLGGAIGNAMGSIVENWTYEKIEKTYGRIEDPLQIGRIAKEDDNRIGLLFCEAFLRHGKHITPEDLAEIWLDQFDPGTDFFWCMRNTLELLRKGVSPRQTGMYNINTGSAIMAIAPVGIYNAMEPARAFTDALDLAYMYQPQPDAQAAATLAAGIAKAIEPNTSPEAIVATMVDIAPLDKLTYWNDRDLTSVRASMDVAVDIASKYGTDWWGARREIYDRLAQWHAIDPVEVLSITTCIFQMTQGDYHEGCIAATNVGRDADTITNLVGALCGALHGAECIPEEWREGVQECAPAVYDRFQAIAQKFGEILSQKAKNYA
ncbi:MAG TPA: ADP-ribosylglycohydrolase family protein, partial [Candidatus Lokiarchaeia archaeon]|nr:ADP-ribosylglycohydrolase family protein [Candidatus Lokiarchaeia archaeon]